MSLSDSMVSQLFGYQTSIRSTEWTLFGVMLGVGVVSLGVGVLLLRKIKRANKAQQQLVESD